ncbi:hypothetical protein [Erythrobacter dokdonensis]|uniref:Uncharacterized protein n=1 Tax=Erythrobacter dokdonensis DSW-74 TaxID=1300349 RepID=A0A1A7BCT6_9SPHN|nr:hypothetical protein [Erythrobacter dokdonensis]OBV10333.1 hypothetical protein I603_2295 [Erythrobacter dokdonensis DSW-74]
MPDRLRAGAQGRGWWALGGLAALICALRAGGLLFDHSLNSIDGALQTWFALDHFADGDQLGTGFQSYLGITMVLALLPVFLLFGQTLFASTLAANVAMIAGAFGAAYATVWLIRAVPPRASWQAALVLIFGFYYAAPLVAEGAGLRWPATFDPGVSLRPLRGFLPFIVLPLFVVQVRRVLLQGRALSGGLLLGLAAGVGLLWSNDAGIPLVIALVLGLVMALHRRLVLLARTMAAFGLGVIAAAGAILLAVTHAAPGPWLQYNFRDVAGDQFWFFAPWERSTRILGVGDLPNILRHGELLSTASLIVLTLCMLWAVVQRLRGRSAPVRGSAFIVVGASVIGTALIPQIGGHIGAEYNAITFVLGACAPLIIGQRILLRWTKPLLRNASPAKTGMAVGVAALAIVGIEAARLVTVCAGTDRTTYDAGLGFHVTPEYAADLAAMRQLAQAWDAQGIAQDRRLLSAYTSPLDIAAGVESPAPVGSLIHALGADNRANFTALVGERKVAAVTTIAPDYSGWEGWIRRANWPFFRALHENYTPIARNDQQVLWVRAETATPPIAAATCRVSAPSRSTLALDIAAPASGLASVSVTRQPPFATRRSAMLTVTEASPDTAAKADRWADFPRYGIGNTALVSLVTPVTAGTTTRLTIEVLDGSDIGTATCTAQIYAPVDTAALPRMPEGIARYLAQAAP